MQSNLKGNLEIVLLFNVKLNEILLLLLKNKIELSELQFDAVKSSISSVGKDSEGLDKIEFISD